MGIKRSHNMRRATRSEAAPLKRAFGAVGAEVIGDLAKVSASSVRNINNGKDGSSKLIAKIVSAAVAILGQSAAAEPSTVGSFVELDWGSWSDRQLMIRQTGDLYGLPSLGPGGHMAVTAGTVLSIARPTDDQLAAIRFEERVEIANNDPKCPKCGAELAVVARGVQGEMGFE